MEFAGVPPDLAGKGESIMTQSGKPKSANKGRKAGRPPTLTMPEPIDDTPENVAEAILTTKPKKRNEWRFMQQKAQQRHHAATQEGSA